MSAGSAENSTIQSIADDLPCRRCGYNLRGISSEGCCPECGLKICLIPYRDRPLSHSDPAWLGTLVRGITLLSTVFLAWTLLLFIVGVAETFSSASMSITFKICALAGPRSWVVPLMIRSRDPEMNGILAVLLLIPIAIHLYAIYLLTDRDPANRYEKRSRDWEFWARLANTVVIIGLVSVIGSAANQGFVMRLDVAKQFATVLAIIDTISSFLLCAYFRRLARRTNDITLAEEIARVQWGLAMIGAVAAIGIAFGQIRFFSLTTYKFSLVVMTGQFVFHLLLFMLLVRLKAAILKAKLGG